MIPENKQNRRYKQINIIGLLNNRNPSQHTVFNVHRASGNCQQRPLYESIAEPLSHILGLLPRLLKRASFIMKDARISRRGGNPRTYDSGSVIDS
jgi:hypothetical protein